MASANTVCVLGLGYVGLPLAIAFDDKSFHTIGYDISEDKIESLRTGEDPTGDVGRAAISDSIVEFTAEPAVLGRADFILVAVPTPISKSHSPKLEYVVSAGETIGEHLSPDTTVVLESTVFPGATREVLLPAIGRRSGLVAGIDYSYGYSPERLVPGDSEHSLQNVVKIVSGDSEDTLSELVELYESVVDAGIHAAPSIEVAETAKIVENIQRDLNIALVNELAIACNEMGIDSRQVLEAAGTKWNFHEYYPGLVGGHCIPVDPLYFIYGSEESGFSPELVEKAREVNEYVPKHVGMEVVKMLNEAGKVIRESKILILGLTYKPGVSDIRTSVISKTIDTLSSFSPEIVGYDPYVDISNAEEAFGIPVLYDLSLSDVDAIIIGTGHQEFRDIDFSEVAPHMSDNPIIYDVDGGFSEHIDTTTVRYSRL
jgi:UDP-N-acetyl-D-galactosamine dehydrogenase